MRVTFDAQIFCSQEFGGISRYFASLAHEMRGMQGIDLRIVAPLYFNAYLARLPAELVRGHKVGRPSKLSLPVRAASLLTADLLQRFPRPDLIHKTYYYPLPRTPRGVRSVVTVYDMIHEKFPQSFSSRDPITRWKARTVAEADHVICISEHTRRDLLSTYEIPEDRVSVTHLGYDSLVSLLTDESAFDFRTRVFGADVPYLLYVGSRDGYKNFGGLLRAFAMSPWLREHFHLLCFGGGGLSDAERRLIAQSGLTDRVRQIGGSDAVLASCYRHAALFVYPSLYEGFGIPPLEAMSLDCPVACSNTSSIPEVVGDAAAYFDPADSEAIRVALEAVLGSPVLCASLVERGGLRRELFSWRRCAQETVDIYRKVVRL
ncbi:MAG: glycosyltransferase family 1 protein [Thiobacillus sp.]|nr:glycosyltransferase family 1 protein [Thiobacillus sp.]